MPSAEESTLGHHSRAFLSQPRGQLRHNKVESALHRTLCAPNSLQGHMRYGHGHMAENTVTGSKGETYFIIASLVHTALPGVSEVGWPGGSGTPDLTTAVAGPVSRLPVCS